MFALGSLMKSKHYMLRWNCFGRRAAKMGIQRPSLYAAFGDKKEFFEASLRKYNQFHASYVRTRLQSVPSVKEAFRAFFEGNVTETYEGAMYNDSYSNQYQDYIYVNKLGERIKPQISLHRLVTHADYSPVENMNLRYKMK